MIYKFVRDMVPGDSFICDDNTSRVYRVKEVRELSIKQIRCGILETQYVEVEVYIVDRVTGKIIYMTTSVIGFDNKLVFPILKEE